MLQEKPLVIYRFRAFETLYCRVLASGDDVIAQEKTPDYLFGQGKIIETQLTVKALANLKDRKIEKLNLKNLNRKIVCLR